MHQNLNNALSRPRRVACVSISFTMPTERPCERSETLQSHFLHICLPVSEIPSHCMNWVGQEQPSRSRSEKDKKQKNPMTWNLKQSTFSTKSQNIGRVYIAVWHSLNVPCLLEDSTLGGNGKLEQATINLAGEIWFRRFSLACGKEEVYFWSYSQLRKRTTINTSMTRVSKWTAEKGDAQGTWQSFPAEFSPVKTCLQLKQRRGYLMCESGFLSQIDRKTKRGGAKDRCDLSLFGTW